MRRRLRQRREQIKAPAAESPGPASRPDPAARGARAVRSGVNRSAAGRLGTAIDCFNASQASRTVAGLMRTLGTPSVSVGASAGTPDEVRITVAWELTWYQWGVDLGAGSRPVFEIDNGRELGQLDAPARQWNASAIEAGRIVLAAPEAGTPGAPARR
jgi:hypothetical protein